LLAVLPFKTLGKLLVGGSFGLSMLIEQRISAKRFAPPERIPVPDQTND
jgi:hypothetical protein